MKKNDGFKFPYFLVGVGVGAVATLVFALRAGGDMRKYLRERSNESLDYLNRQTGKLRESADKIVKKAKEFVSGHGDLVKTDTEGERQAYEEKKRENLGG
jgi:gas vesicle protein